MTLRDVAEAAGVHPATASRALNPRTRGLVSPDTARRVLEAASRLEYQPNPAAKALRTARTSTVAVLIPDITNPLFPPILRGIEEVLEDAGYAVFTANCGYDLERERRHYQIMASRQVDGFIVATALRRYPLLAELQALHRPVVLLNRTVEGGGLPAVTADDEGGMRALVQHLACLGHRTIGHLAGPQDTSTGHLRRRGFLRAMRAHGLPADRGLVVVARRFTEEEGARTLVELLRRRPDVTAVTAGNDRMAVGCYAALQELGLRCPQDVSVTGFNDLPFMDRISPPLTTIRVEQREVGRLAATLVLEQLERGDVPGRTIVVPTELVVRGSTAPPRPHGAALAVR